MFRKSLVTAAVFCLCPMASGVVLTSFEEFGLGDTVNGNGTIVDSGPGVTDGAKALELISPGTEQYDKLGHFILNDYADPTAAIANLAADWFFSPDAGSNGSYNGLAVAFFNQTTSTFTQLNGGGPYVDQGPLGDQAYVNSVYALTPGEQALVTTALTNGEPLEVGFYANKDAGVAGVFTIDRIQFDGVLLPTAPSIPEPASAALLVSGLALIATRRRK